MNVMLLSILGSSIVVIAVVFFGFKKVLDLVNTLHKTESRNLKILKDEIDESFINLRYHLKEFETTISNNISSFEQVISNNHQSLLVDLKNTRYAMTKMFQQQNVDITTNIDSLNKAISTLDKSLVANLQKNQESIQTKLIETNKNLLNSQVKQEKYIMDITSDMQKNYNGIVGFLNNLKLDNIINVSNEISKYKNCTLEDGYFLQEFTSCKIIRFTDKQTNETTEVFYNENGEKSYTETFIADKLKYKMYYSNDILSRGIEYNKNGQVIAEYEYDEAGEISKKLEYEYNNDGTEKQDSK